MGVLFPEGNSGCFGPVSQTFLIPCAIAMHLSPGACYGAPPKGVSKRRKIVSGAWYLGRNEGVFHTIGAALNAGCPALTNTDYFHRRRARTSLPTQPFLGAAQHNPRPAHFPLGRGLSRGTSTAKLHLRHTQRGGPSPSGAPNRCLYDKCQKSRCHGPGPVPATPTALVDPSAPDNPRTQGRLWRKGPH